MVRLISEHRHRGAGGRQIRASALVEHDDFW
jgi:hypothetical protein